MSYSSILDALVHIPEWADEVVVREGKINPDNPFDIPQVRCHKNGNGHWVCDRPTQYRSTLVAFRRGMIHDEYYIVA